jgi:hypothetical protein
MDAAIENGDLEALLTPAKSTQLSPLSVSGRSALPPLSERRVMVARHGGGGMNVDTRGHAKKRSATAAVGTSPSSSSPSSVLSSLSQNNNDDVGGGFGGGGAAGFAGKTPLGHRGGSVHGGAHGGAAPYGGGLQIDTPPPPQPAFNSLRRGSGAPASSR